MTLLIDTHCHLDAEIFQYTLDQIIDQAICAGVEQFIIPGVNSHWQNMFRICESYEGCYAAPGLHPLYLDTEMELGIHLLEKHLEHPKVVAIGETGLDFYHNRVHETLQRDSFSSHIKLAIKYQLPLLLHVRKAHDDILAMLRRYRYPERGAGGIVHAYSGSLQQAEHYINMGFCIGIGGTISYERAQRIRKIVQIIPKKAIVLETDAPDIPLCGYQGEPNIPSRLIEIASILAEIRGEKIEEVAFYSVENTKRLFRKMNQ